MMVLAPRRVSVAPLWMPILVMLSAFAGLVALSRNAGEGVVYLFVGAMLLAFSGLGCAYRSAVTIGARVVFAVAALFHLVGLFGLPLLEDDHYRYVWDGYRFVTSGSPYGVAPASFFADSGVPVAMRGALDGINYPELPTIYAPLLQYLFGAGYLIAPGSFWPIRVLLVLSNLALIALLLRSGSPRMVLLYAWNPLVFKEVALTGHPDALLALPLLLAWHWRAVGGVWLKGILFGLALAIKISVLPTMAWLLWKRRQWSVPIAIAVMLATYLPFAGSDSDLPGLLAFAQDWQFNAAVFALLGAVLDPDLAKPLCAAVAIAMMFLIQWQARHSDACPPWHRVFGVLLLFSPVINAWYLLWLLPFAVYGRDLWPWVASFALCFSYVTGLNTGREDICAFELLPWAQVAQWSLIGVALCIDLKCCFASSAISEAVTDTAAAAHPAAVQSLTRPG